MRSILPSSFWPEGMVTVTVTGATAKAPPPPPRPPRPPPPGINQACCSERGSEILVARPFKSPVAEWHLEQVLLKYASPAAALPTTCAPTIEASDVQVTRVEKNGVLVLVDGRAVHLEGILLPQGDKDHAPDFLAAVAPSDAAISVGRRNFYGHPRHEVLEQLQAAHVFTWRTDVFGLSTFYLDGKRVQAASWADR